MKIFRIAATTTIILLSAIYSATAQSDKNLFAVSWEVAFPSGNKYLSETSWAGGRLEFRHFLKPNLSIGLATSWNSFDEYVPNTTYKSGTTSVTTDMVRQIYTVPITAIVHYYFNVSNPRIKPYAGIGLGTQYAEQNSYFNIYLVEDNNWGFVARPEIGAFFKLGGNASIMLAGSYNYATNKNETFDMDDLKQFAINLGVAWTF